MKHVHQGFRIKCQLCPKTVSQRSTLKHHMFVEHGIAKKSLDQCHICKASFRDKSALKRHLRRTCMKEIPIRPDHENTLVKCDHCEKSYKSEVMFSHMKIDHGCSLLKCTLCTKSFAYSGTLKHHMFVVHGIGTPRYQCNICITPFRDNCRLSRHLDLKTCIKNPRFPKLQQVQSLECSSVAAMRRTRLFVLLVRCDFKLKPKKSTKNEILLDF